REGRAHPPGQSLEGDSPLRADHRAHDGVPAPAGLQIPIAGQAAREQLALLGRQLVVEHGGKLAVELLVHPNSSARPRPPSKTSRSRRSIASRARKMRERTVPTGQAMAAAISS